MGHDTVLRLEAVSKIFPGGLRALDDVTLDIGQGEFLSLLGPSGCGKTTCLRLIAGFEEPSTGRVLLEGREITALRPFDRPVNTVFQDYALFPHMDVSENVGFGLSLRRQSSSVVRTKVADALAMVGLSDKLGARVASLSGGQRQRVALARAIVCEPRVLLLDEPLSALDAHLREQMQIELKNLQARLGTTFVMVTHDQTEALSISDRIAVMNRGRIEQVAPPAALYDTPATRFVAGFIGTMNVLECRLIRQSGIELSVSAGPLSFLAQASQGDHQGPQVAVGIRPEDLLLDADELTGSTPARLIGTIFHGRALRLHAVLSDGTPLTIDTSRRTAGSSFAIGDTLFVRVRDGAARALAA